MAFSRFYQPVQTQYISQFVPENLELFDSALRNRQKEYDQTVGQIDLFNDALLQQEALPEYDTEVLKGIKGEVDTFASEMSKLDLSLPENKRKVSQFVKQLASDERLGKIQAGVASKKKYDEIKEALIKKNKYVPENDLEFMKAFESYLGQQGDDKKFGVDFIGGKELIPEDAPSRPELEKVVDNMKASGYTYDRENGTWIDRKSGKGISYNQLMDVLKSNIGPFSQTVEGIQLGKRAEMNNRTYEEQFLSEIDPIARERAYKETSNTFRDNTARLDRLKRWEEESKFRPVTQPGKTPVLNSGFNSVAEINQTINEMKAKATETNDPKLMKEANKLEAQKEQMHKAAISQLGKSEQEILAYDIEKAKNEISIKKVDGALDIREKGKLWEKAKKNVEGELSIKGFKRDFGFEDSEVTDEEILKEFKDLKAKEIGLSLDKIQKKIDKNIESGITIPQKEILLPISKYSDQAKASIYKFGQTALTDSNFEYQIYDTEGQKQKESSDFGNSLEQISSKLNPNSIKITTDGYNGFTIEAKTVGTNDIDPEIITMRVKEWNPVVENYVKELTLNDPETFNEIKNAYDSEQIGYVAEGSDYSQTSDIGISPQLGDFNISKNTTKNGQSDGYYLNNLNHATPTSYTYKNFIEVLSSVKEEGRNAVLESFGISVDNLLKNPTKPIKFKNPAQAKKFLEFSTGSNPDYYGFYTEEFLEALSTQN